MRDLKILGMVIAALLVTSAFAGAAQAAEFHSASENTTISGTNKVTTGVKEGKTVTTTIINHFKTSVFDVTCETVNFSVSQEAKTSTSIAVTPTYSNCHVIVLFTFAAEVKFNGCNFNFNANGTAKLECAKAGETVEIISAGCSIKIPAQTVESAATYTNTSHEGSKKRLLVKSTAKNIAYSQSGSSCATKEAADAEYTGEGEVGGTVGGVAVDIWYE